MSLLQTIQIYLTTPDEAVGNEHEESTPSTFEMVRQYLAYILEVQYAIETKFIEDTQQIEEHTPVAFITYLESGSLENPNWQAKAESFINKLEGNTKAFVAWFGILPSQATPPFLSNLEIQKFTWRKEIVTSTDEQLFQLFDLIEVMCAAFWGNSRKTQQTTAFTQKVFLAEAGNDLSLGREVIRRELMSRGVEVITLKEYPTEEEELEEVLLKQLKECSISIHLFGEQTSGKYTASGILLEDAQNKIAASYCQQETGMFSGFERFIWLSNTLNNAEKEQERLISQILKDSYLQTKADVIRSTLEEFKDIIEEKIAVNALMNEDMEWYANHHVVYIIHKQEGWQEAKRIANQFKEYHYTPFTSLDVDKDKNPVEKHKELLRHCKGAFIHYQDSDEDWLHSRMSSVLKMRSERKMPYDFKAVGTAQHVAEHAYAAENNMLWVSIADGFYVEAIMKEA